MTIDVFERAHNSVEAFLHMLRLGHRDMFPVQDSNDGKNITVENGAGLGICLLYPLELGVLIPKLGRWRVFGISPLGASAQTRR